MIKPLVAARWCSRKRTAEMTVLEFFGIYNETFRYIDEHFGRRALDVYWAYISKNYLKKLRRLVAEKGTEGMKEYWGHTLADEGAKYRMEITPDTMHAQIIECPAIRWLKSHKKEIYPDYCQHCVRLYQLVMEDYGFTWQMQIDDLSGSCRISVRRKQGEKSAGT